MHLILVLLFLFVLFGFLYSVKSKKTEVFIKSKKVNRNYKFVFLADYHSNPGRGILKILKDECINADYVFLGGDIVDDKAKDFRVDELFSILKNNKVFYVLGNHEVRREDLSKLTSYFKEHSIYLERANSPIEIDDLSIYGVEDKSVNYNDFIFSLEDFKTRIDNNRFNILLSHRPEHFDEYKDIMFDLVLTGHAHGGHVRLPFIGGLVAPGQGLFPKYQGGIYENNGCKMFLTTGASKKWYYIPRFLNKPEVAVINIVEDL